MASLTLTKKEKEDQLNVFPNIKLSYEKIIHNKVYPLKQHFLLAIPHGQTCVAWFTLYKEKPVCFIIRFNEENQNRIQSIYSMNACFSVTLCYGSGTILHGTLFDYKNHPYFSMEDIYYYKGSNVYNQDFQARTTFLRSIIKTEIQQIAYSRNFLIFGLPIQSTTYSELDEQLKTVPYPIQRIQIVHLHTNHFKCAIPIQKYEHFQQHSKQTPLPLPMRSTLSISKKKNDLHAIHKQTTKTQLKQTRLQYKQFFCKADLQNEVYHLYSFNNTYVGVACIPDYKTSVLMNKLFRNIKENIDLDKLEESDEEDEFENENLYKFVDINKTVLMNCIYNDKFKKWVPLHIAQK